MVGSLYQHRWGRPALALDLAADRRRGRVALPANQAGIRAFPRPLGGFARTVRGVHAATLGEIVGIAIIGGKDRTTFHVADMVDDLCFA
jgi:hypothetical protein